MYRTMVGNPYKTIKTGESICTTTNGTVKYDGKAVMGAGNAKFVRDQFGLDALLGKLLTKYGNRVFPLGKHRYNGQEIMIFTFPTKEYWRNNSSLSLIRKSAIELREIADKLNITGNIYIPAPGCSNGGLRWSQVKEQLHDLDFRFIVYSLEADTFLF